MLKKIINITALSALLLTAPASAGRSSYSLTISLPAPVKAPANFFREDETLRSVGAPIVSLHPLFGKKLGNLNARYIGFEGETPRFARTSWKQNIYKMWLIKFKVAGITDEGQRGRWLKIADRYDEQASRTTLPGFVAQVESEARRVKQSLDFNRFCAVRRIDQGGCALLRDIAFQINGEHLTAYCMTELFPNRNGEVNVRFLNVILPSAGSEYLNSIPAQGDKLMSYGCYQFTSHALQHGKDGPQAASIVNQFVSDQSAQIPGSVMKLQGGAHDRAAYMLAVYNLSEWIRLSTPSERSELRRLYPTHMGEVTQFMAVAHHLPNGKHGAIAKARAWVRGHGKQSLVAYLGPKLEIYANKTISNGNALHRALQQRSVATK